MASRHVLIIIYTVNQYTLIFYMHNDVKMNISGIYINSCLVRKPFVLTDMLPKIQSSKNRYI